MDRREHTEEWRTDIGRHRFGRDRPVEFVSRDPFVGKDMEREKRHDNGVLWMQHNERRKVDAEGGKVIGERSELRLNREIKREMAYIRRANGRKTTVEERAEIARRYDLPLTENGQIMIPDAQMLIENEDGSREIRNLEFVTENYRDTRAGFTIGAPRGRWHKPNAGPDIPGKIMR